MELGLSETYQNLSLDKFLHQEGYELCERRYHHVVSCWCGCKDLEQAVGNDPVYAYYQVCNDCGCLLLKHVLPKSGLAELYGMRYFREHQVAIGLPAFYERYENDAHDRIPIWIEIVRSLLETGRVLEIGCSHGRFLHELAKTGYDVVGLEMDAEIASWTRSKTGLDVREASLSSIEDKNFNLIFAADVLEHVYSPTEFINDSLRVLEPDGIALFQTVIFDDWKHCPTGMLRPLYHTILYNSESLKKLIPYNAQLKRVYPGPFGCDIIAIEKIRVESVQSP